MGRHIRFPGGQFTHKASGLLYQSGAAEMQKIKIIECHKTAKEVGARLMLSVHDELNFSVHDNPEAAERLNETYCDFKSPEAVLRLRVPIRSSVGVGPNWWEASK
jgi:DNA polymerase I-like protein with 3'-5' exonuclease and polymerase domains